MPGVLLLHNLNGIKKHVEDISVDSALGFEFCCVVVIYDANYNIKNSNYSNLPYHHYHSPDIDWVLPVIL